MPEGPEIRRMVDDIGAAIERRKARHVRFAFAALHGFERALSGRRVTRVAARGKAVLVFFSARGDDGPWCVYSHNQLYGKWLIGRPGDTPDTRRQLRFAVETADTAARLYSASDIRVVRPDTLDEIGYLARLGPDPLNDTLAAGALAAQLDASRFAGRALGGLLLDQSFVAGVGNYLRSEILFAAGLHPSRTPASLHAAERTRLVDAIDTLIERAYRLAGITNDEARAAQLEREGVSFAQRRHMVFNRAGLPCYACGTRIEKRQVASRRLYLCPNCQPDGPPG